MSQNRLVAVAALLAGCNGRAEADAAELDRRYGAA